MAMIKNRQSNQVTDLQLKKEIMLHFELAKLYEKHQYKKKILNAKEWILEAYRAAADLDDAMAQYNVGKILVENGKFWQQMAATPYVCDAHHRYAKMLFEEAFAYLGSAQKQGHALAIRLKGLCLINGWGLEKDEDAGFKLVVDSIEKEGTWDKATQIFQENGLNKPEFFSSIMTMRQQQNK